MPAVGLEPTRRCHQQILSLPRLPFRHAGFLFTLIIMYEYLITIFQSCYQQIYDTILKRKMQVNFSKFSCNTENSTILNLTLDNIYYQLYYCINHLIQ